MKSVLVRQLKQNMQAELTLPGLNPALLAELSSEQKAVQESYQEKLTHLSQAASAGDIAAWQQAYPALEKELESVTFSNQEELGLQVELKKLELTLLFNAGNMALAESQECQTKAKACQDFKEVRDLQKKSQQLIRRGEQIHRQLREKLKV